MHLKTKNSLSSSERLKNKGLIEKIFSKESHSLYEEYLTLKYCTIDNSDSTLKVGFSVSKRYYKKAVDRNKLKRRLRESYRVQNRELNTILAQSDKKIILFFMLNSMPKEPSFQKTTELVSKLLLKLTHNLSNTLK